MGDNAELNPCLEDLEKLINSCTFPHVTCHRIEDDNRVGLEIIDRLEGEMVLIAQMQDESLVDIEMTLLLAANVSVHSTHIQKLLDFYKYLEFLVGVTASGKHRLSLIRKPFNPVPLNGHYTCTYGASKCFTWNNSLSTLKQLFETNLGHMRKFYREHGDEVLAKRLELKI